MPWVQRPRPGIPSYETNFAGPDRLPPANPNLWQGLGGHWDPTLGVTGLTLPNIAGHQQGTLTSDLWDMGQSWRDLSLDGAADAITIETGVLAGATEFTMAGWVRKKGATDVDILWEHSANFNGNEGSFVVWFDSTSGERVYASRKQALGYNQAYWTIALGTTWHHLAILFSEVTASLPAQRLWLDGTERTITTQTHDAATTGLAVLDLPTYMGARAASSLFLACDLGPQSAWNRALSSNEIQQLFVDTHAITRPMQRLFVGGGAAAPAGAIMKQLQGSNVGADLFNGSLI